MNLSALKFNQKRAAFKMEVLPFVKQTKQIFKLHPKPKFVDRQPNKGIGFRNEYLCAVVNTSSFATPGPWRCLKS